MPKFAIIESRPATYYWEYEVEAENEEEALALVMDEKVKPFNTDIEVSDDDSEYSVEDID